MALITNNISGSSSDSWRIGITGSVKFGNPGGDNNQLQIPDFPGNDVYFFVSGSRGGKGGTNRTVAVFGGDAVVSGSLTVGTGSITITSNEIQFGNGAARIFSGSSGLTLVDSGGSRTLAQIIAAGGGGSGTNYWGEAALNKIYSTGSVAIGVSTAADAQGADVFLFVSGSNAAGSSARLGLFGGPVVISGSYLQLKDSTGTTKIDIQNAGTISGSSNIQAGGTLTIAGAASLNSTLTVAGASTLAAVTATTVSGSGNFQVGGNITLQGDLDTDVSEDKTLFGSVGSGKTITLGGSLSTVKIPGNLTVQGSVTTIDTTNLVIEDPLIYFNSGSTTSNTGGGIAIASGSSVTHQSLVWGRVANDTWGAGRKDVLAGTETDLTVGVVLLPVRASKFEVGGTSAFISSSNGNVLALQGATDLILTTAGGAPGSNGDISFQFGSPGTTVLQVSGSGTDTLHMKVPSGVTTANVLANLTATQTVNLATGATAAANTKTLNIGTSGLAGSTTNINLGSSAGGTIVAFTNLEPTGDKVQNLGSATKRWANIYTGDLHLRNERGDWTVIEEEDFLTITNNKSGKRYKFLMEEI